MSKAFRMYESKNADSLFFLPDAWMWCRVVITFSWQRWRRVTNRIGTSCIRGIHQVFFFQLTIFVAPLQEINDSEVLLPVEVFLFLGVAFPDWVLGVDGLFFGLFGLFSAASFWTFSNNYCCFDFVWFNKLVFGVGILWCLIMFCFAFVFVCHVVASKDLG